jgi:hypothetical protein
MAQFDAALAFVVLLLLLSLVVTALVQAAIALFDIRGGNLKSAIVTILRQAGMAQDVEAVADRVVKYPPLRGALYRAKAVSKDELLLVLKALDVTDASVQEGVERWFQPVMDRSSDWFVAKSRGWTVGFSLALALGLGVDGIATYGRLLRDPGLRANLIASADAVTRQAEQVLDGAPVRLAATQVAATDPGAEALRGVPSELVSCRQVDGWLAASHPALSADVREEFRNACEEQSQKMLTGTAANLTGLGEQLQAGGIDLCWARTRPTEVKGRQILGMLLTAILLSLGGPFWFNALRQLATLRPVVAQKISPKS